MALSLGQSSKLQALQQRLFAAEEQIRLIESEHEGTLRPYRSDVDVQEAQLEGLRDSNAYEAESASTARLLDTEQNLNATEHELTGSDTMQRLTDAIRVRDEHLRQSYSSRFTAFVQSLEKRGAEYKSQPQNGENETHTETASAMPPQDNETGGERRSIAMSSSLIGMGLRVTDARSP